MTFATEMCNIAIHKADVIERQSGKCFNCKELGHYWRDCPKPLREESNACKIILRRDRKS